MIEHVAPSLICFAVILGVIACYSDWVKYLFRVRRVWDDPAERFPGDDLAVRLQEETNRWHALAVSAKTRYEAIGVGAASAAPALIWLAALEPALRDHGFASDQGVWIARGLVLLALLAIVWVFRTPASSLVKLRLRAELTRLYLHCHLANIPPPPFSDLREASLPDLYRRLSDMEDNCVRHSHAPSLAGFNHARAALYHSERVDEQRWFFARSSKRDGLHDTRSSRALLAGISISALCAFAKTIGAESSFWDAGFLVAGGAGVLIVALRSLFAWEARSGLYGRQAARLTPLDEELSSMLNAGRPLAAPELEKFLKTAAQFEQAMAQEARDWAILTDRRIYDVSA